ncbi:MAG TPA: rod shape-determining protein MreC [Candidatus Acidoferrum sp.]|nr:rod shape-determining protein MreC [Candidatus Acidoferrum sp.]
MAGLPSRHRSLFLLLGVVLLQVLLLAVQIKRDSQGRLIRVWTVSAVSPFQRSGAWGVGKVRDAWRHYFALSDTARLNEQLIRENGALKLEVLQLQGKSAEADRLAALLNFKQKQNKVPMVVARVIGSSADPNSSVIYIDQGQRDGIRRNMGVITPEGVVGKVIESYRDASLVLLVTDRDSGVGAMIADSRIQSPVGGTGEPLLNMKYVGNDDEVAVGSRVVTSGMDRIFPKDLPVGTITQVKPGGQYKQIRVKPSASLEKLEEVLVLLTTDPLVLAPEPSPQAGGSSAPPRPAPAKAAPQSTSAATTNKPSDKRP